EKLRADRAILVFGPCYHIGAQALEAIALLFEAAVANRLIVLPGQVVAADTVRGVELAPFIKPFGVLGWGEGDGLVGEREEVVPIFGFKWANFEHAVVSVPRFYGRGKALVADRLMIMSKRGRRPRRCFCKSDFL